MVKLLSLLIFLTHHDKFTPNVTPLDSYPKFINSPHATFSPKPSPTFTTKSTTQPLPEKMDILDQCMQGDRMAQKALYQRHKNKMFVLCLRYANSREDAEDILQEGFVKVFRDLHQYKGIGNLEGWIRKVILNVALQYIRKQKQLKLQLTSDFELWENSLVVDTEQEPFDRELVKKILHLMQQMPIGFRTVLNLYVMEEYSHQQIADELGISVGTSKSQLNRAKAYLRELVEKVIRN